MIGDKPDIQDLGLLDWMLINSISLDELEDWMEQRRWGDLAKRG